MTAPRRYLRDIPIGRAEWGILHALDPDGFTGQVDVLAASIRQPVRRTWFAIASLAEKQLIAAKPAADGAVLAVLTWRGRRRVQRRG